MIITYQQLITEKKKEEAEIFYQDLLNTVEWKEKRKVIISRDFGLCRKCGYSETYAEHYDSETKKWSCLLTDGTEYSMTYTNENGNIVTENNIPTMIAVDKPYILHVHHKYYIYNTLPWDYEEDALITLCNWCHKELHENEAIVMYEDDLFIKNKNLRPCTRCQGTGWFEEFRHVNSGVCFKCRGRRFNTDLYRRKP